MPNCLSPRTLNYFIFGLLLFVGHSFNASAGEKNIVFQGRVVNHETSQLLPDAHLSISTADGSILNKTTTNRNGYFRMVIRLDPKAHTELILVTTYIGFTAKKTLLSPRKPRPIEIRLTPEPVELQEVEVWASPEGVYGTANYYLIDFELHQGHLFVLAHARLAKEPLLLVMVRNDQLMYTHRVQGKPQTIIEDCTGRLMVFTTTHCFEVLLDTHTVVLEKRDYNVEGWVSANCDAFNGESFLFRVDSHYNYHQEFFSLDTNFRTQDLRTVWDAQRNRQQEDEADFLAAGNYRMDHPRDYEPPIGLQVIDPLEQHLLNRKRQQESRFGQQIMLSPIFSQMFYVGDTIFFFNHVNHYMEALTQDGVSLWKKNTQYAKRIAWGKFLVQDPISNQLYTFMSGLNPLKVYRIDQKTGKTHLSMTSKRSFAEKIRVYDGEVFFLYRNAANPLKTRLGRQFIQ